MPKEVCNALLVEEISERMLRDDDALRKKVEVFQCITVFFMHSF